MICYEVIFQKKAEKWLRENKAFGLRFCKAFTEISENINENFIKYDIIRLKGSTDFFRLRIGKFRAIFKIENEELLILVIDIDSRGGIYK